jgi:hypothetical protein
MLERIRLFWARAVDALRRLAVFVLRPFRRLLGRMLQAVEQDALRQLSSETARLSAASVEAVGYMGDELRRVDEELSALRSEVAELRRLLEAAEGQAEVERASSPSVSSS